MSLSENFSRAEFLCRCGNCNQDTVDAELINILQAVRDHFGVSVTVTSGNRCPAHNAKIGGSPKSQHLFSRAADVIVKDIHPVDVSDFVETLMPNHGGIGVYAGGWTHIDTRSTKSRWVG